MNPFNTGPSTANNSNFDFSMLQNNPIFKMLKNRGMSNEDIIRYMCQQRGIDFNQFMQQAAQLYRNNNR